MPDDPNAAPTAPPSPDALAAELAATRAELAALRANTAADARSRSIDAALGGASDPATARVLLEHAIKDAPADGLDAAIAAAAAALRAKNPALFVPTPNGSRTAAPAAPVTDPAAAELEAAKKRAATTGRHQDVVDYMRRRNGQA